MRRKTRAPKICDERKKIKEEKIKVGKTETRERKVGINREREKNNVDQFYKGTKIKKE